MFLLTKNINRYDKWSFACVCVCVQCVVTCIVLDLSRHTLYSTLFDPLVMSVLCGAPNYFSPGCVFVCLSAASFRSDFSNVNETLLQRWAPWEPIKFLCMNQAALAFFFFKEIYKKNRWICICVFFGFIATARNSMWPCRIVSFFFPTGLWRSQLNRKRKKKTLPESKSGD